MTNLLYKQELLFSNTSKLNKNWHNVVHNAKGPSGGENRTEYGENEVCLLIFYLEMYPRTLYQCKIVLKIVMFKVKILWYKHEILRSLCRLLPTLNTSIMFFVSVTFLVHIHMDNDVITNYGYCELVVWRRPLD